MPFIGLVHLAIAAFFGVHAIRSGQPIYWLFVLFAFPLFGSIVYAFAIYLPQMRYTRGGMKAARTVQSFVDPDRELREADAEFDRTPTAYNRARLAAAMLGRGQAEESIGHYRAAASGPYERTSAGHGPSCSGSGSRPRSSRSSVANIETRMGSSDTTAASCACGAQDASFLEGLARAELAAGKPADAAATLERLFAAHPALQRGALAIAHAEALAGAGSERARAAFDAVVARDASTEARYKYGAFLLSRGDDAGARRAFETVLLDAERGHFHSRELNREWIAQSKAELKRMSA